MYFVYYKQTYVYFGFVGYSDLNLIRISIHSHIQTMLVKQIEIKKQE